MPGKTITSGTIGVVLTDPVADNPATANLGVSVVTTALDAVYGNGNAAWTVNNSGTLRNTATAAPGPSIAAYSAIGLAIGGTVNNGDTGNASALIGAVAGSAIRSGGSATVTNFGSILATGAVADGISIALGGTVANNGAASRIGGGRNGIYMNGAVGTVTNTGSISGNAGVGVNLRLGGTLVNGSILVPTAQISGATGVTDSFGSLTVTNLGLILATSGIGVALVGGGTVTNGASGASAAVIAGGTNAAAVYIAGGLPQLTNFGTLTAGSGVMLHTVGTINNQGVITGRYGYGAAFHVAGYLANAAGARITGAKYGLFATGAVTAVTAGTLAATGTAGIGAYLLAGGTLTNVAGGLIAGVTAISSINIVQATIANAGTIAGTGGGIYVAVGSGRVANTGTISGTAKYGISFTKGGSVVNGAGGAATAVISGGTVGLQVIGGPATVANDGQLTGSTAGLYVAAGGTVTNGTSGASTGTIVANTGTGAMLRSTGASLLLNNFGLIQGGGSGLSFLGGGTLNNQGSIAGNSFYGAVIDSGQINNLSSGQISAPNSGLDIATAATTIVNGGTVLATASGGNGVLLRTGGTISNGIGAPAARIAATSTVSGSGILARTVASTVVNQASISGSNYGIELQAGGIVTNAVQGGPGLIAGGVGVRITGAGTVTNAGTINGVNGMAVRFLGAGAHRMVVLPGAVFGNNTPGGIGSVDAPGTATNVLELAGSAGSTGTLSGNLGGAFTGFQTVAVDAGVNWTLTGANSAATLTNAGTLDLTAVTAATIQTLANTGTVLAGRTGLLTYVATLSGSGTLALAAGTLEVTSIAAAATVILAGAGAVLRLDVPAQNLGTLAGFVATDLVALPGLAHAGSDKAILQPGNILHITAAAGTFDLKLAPAESFAGRIFSLTANGIGNSVLTVACFATGTRIRTAHGEVAVEALRIGDLVASAFGGWVPLKWLGHRTLDCRRHPRPHDVLPVRVRRHAFGADQPARDLVLSPDHAVHVAGAQDGRVLIPVRYLVNGATVTQEPADTITYWHVELPAHDVLFAENLACESYLDTGNRSAFANAGVPPMLHPGFAPPEASPDIWAAEACATLVVGGPDLAAARRRLRAAARKAGHRSGPDPDLHIMVDGHDIAAAAAGRRRSLRLPAGAARLRIVSRVWLPSHMRAADADTRSLGVAVGSLQIDGRPVDLDDGRLASGWFASEGDWRWTNGDAVIDLHGARSLAFDLALAGEYWLGCAASRSNAGAAA